MSRDERLENFRKLGGSIREIDPLSEAEIRLVAQRMRQTLAEVLGEEKGGAMYTMDWLLDRVRWHLDPKKTVGKVFLSIAQDGAITGHAIARLERDDAGNPFGYFSTIFIDPNLRRQGVATALIDRVEHWFLGLGMPKVIYNTAENHSKLISLFDEHGYQMTHRESEMVQLTKTLQEAPGTLSTEQWKVANKAFIKERHPGLKEEHIDLHQESAFYWGPENFCLVTDWLKQTLRILEQPETFSNKDLFINFFGIIDDDELIDFLRDKSSRVFKTLGVSEEEITSFIATNRDPEMRRYMERVWEATQLAETVCKDFSEDDKFLLRFLRHRYCHITLSNFSVKIESKDDEVRFKTGNWERLVALSKSTTVTDFKGTLLEKLNKHRGAVEKIKQLIAHEQDDRFLPE